MAQIFISHSSNDKKFAEGLSRDLKDMGHDPWLDEWEIKVGEVIPKKIQEGLSNLDYLVIILSPESVSSGWVEREWMSAYGEEIKKNKIIVLPALLKECKIPKLLSQKKYANFSKNYAVGFADLARAIIPVGFDKKNPFIATETINDEEISALISTIQSKQKPLSLCISEALSIARKCKDKDLLEFCTNELSGLGQHKKNHKKQEEIEKNYGHRFIKVFCSLNEVNPQYMGWGGSVGRMFAYIESDPKEFKPVKMFVSFPISQIEQKKTFTTDKSFRSWTQPITDFNPECKEKDIRVFCYARAEAYDNIVESIRTILTRKLLNLLPEIKTS